MSDDGHLEQNTFISSHKIGSLLYLKSNQQ